MIVEYIRYNLKTDPPEDGDALSRAFEAAYREAAPSLLASPHCQAFELSRCVEEPSRYILRIEWDSREGHMRGFRRSEEFKPFFAAIKPFLPNIAEMTHYETTDVAARK